MNIKDVVDAMEDLVEAHKFDEKAVIHINGVRGPQPINGFDIGLSENFVGLCVLDGDGNYAVSGAVAEKLRKQIADARRKLATAEEIFEILRSEGAHKVPIDAITALLTPTREALKDAESDEDKAEGDDKDDAK